MKFATIRIVPYLLLCALAGLLVGVSVPSQIPPLSAATGNWSQEQRGPARLVARKSGRRSKKSPVAVRNVRMKAYPNYTRVVFDLQRAVTFTQSRKTNPDRAIIELKNTTLGKNARAKLKDTDFPEAVRVTQSRSRTVRVSLDLERIRDYKLLPLNDPPRLVFDVFARGSGKTDRAGAGRAPASNGARNDVARAPRPPQPTIKVIVIDPGHGGKDPGAVGRRGTLEKDIVLKVSLYLRNLIRKRMGKKVLMTRDRDVFIELEDRAEFANKHDADLFVSIHVNSHPKRSVRGLEVYHFGEASDRRALEVAARENGTTIEDTGVGVGFLVADLLTTKKVEDSLELAWTTKESVVSHLNGRYKIVDHGVKTAPFYVLRFTSMPSILAEIGFVSNSKEERQMRTKAFQRRMAEGIFEGIQTYIKSVQVASK